MWALILSKLVIINEFEKWHAQNFWYRIKHITKIIVNG